MNKNQLFISQGQQDLKEVVEHWKQNNHIMAKWFKEDYIEEKPKDFVGKFLAGHEQGQLELYSVTQILTEI